MARDYRNAPKPWLLTFFPRQDERDARPAGGTITGPGDYGPAGQSPASPRGDNLLPFAIGRQLAPDERAADWNRLAAAPRDPIAEQETAESVPAAREPEIESIPPR